LNTSISFLVYSCQPPDERVGKSPVTELLKDVVGAHTLRQACERPHLHSWYIPVSSRTKWLGNLPWRSLSKMSLVRMPYDLFEELASRKFCRKPVNASISILGLLLSQQPLPSPANSFYGRSQALCLK
jgi:hypothetical protein